jgi:ribosome-associated protein
LRLNVREAPFSHDVKDRLVRLAGQRMTTDGWLVISAREHRTQGQNRDAARARLIALLERAQKAPRARRPTRPGAAAREKRLGAKHRRAEIKRARRSTDD